MNCPDCGKTVGRFQVSGDSENDNTKAVLSCPRTGRKMVPVATFEPQSSGDLKMFKSKKSKAKALANKKNEVLGING